MATAANANDDPKTAYENAKKELIAALGRKKTLEKGLTTIEGAIYQLEGSYIIETTSTGGNIMAGFDNYLKAGTSTRKRIDVHDLDRHFSMSSITWKKSLDMGDEDSNDDIPVSGGTPVTTVNIAPATRAQEAQAAQKRERDRMYQRRKRASMRQSTMSEDDEVQPRKRRKNNDD